ncbi:ATP-dependent DNA helicase RecG [Salibacterium qingdaonense]|uniref:ATP-dependent DNA helicase RecG n=1 Tax=Salibacterium qingdaonense TaxID=266892 RepID=A0A1I4PFY9_9BACI|nr:ATP-dependent DNA helicase RecG [Salibacterium qingdaonense]SFM26505.1 ATP-dependent DNA helicase RecG [Salibacterium qingdaonense]
MKTMDEKLKQPAGILHGIGEEKEKELQQLGLFTIYDLLHHFPYRYENMEVEPVEKLRHGDRVTIAGMIQSEPAVRYYGRKKSRLSVRILVENILVTAVFFNRAFLKSRMNSGDMLTLTGKWDKYKLTITVQDVQWGSPDPSRQLQPVYSVGGGITVKKMSRWIQQALQAFGNNVEEVLPESLLSSYRLSSRSEAFHMIHMPADKEKLKQARRRFVYEELLTFQLKMQTFKRQERLASAGNTHEFNKAEVETFLQTLPFPLTGAQRRVIDEITKDMQDPLKMNRLLQGDVGSGKTVVAAAAMYACHLAGGQSALMVPTEILAEQHADGLRQLYAETGLNVVLLTGSVKGRKRRERNTAIYEGEADIVVGTHALIQEDVNFKNLGLVITDEQHRFGVEQRRILRDKGYEPDVLFMTATPIPRTLAISVFGDMDVSSIDELPAGRKPIQTYWVKHGMLERILRFIDKQVKEGRQAYVICPLIEESDMLDVQNAIDVHAQLQQFLDSCHVGLMHGRLSSEEKEQVMQAFAANEIQVLVSTTVVEVGVNVPNASVMLIYDADRFGLSQLHQLRGRIGRGEYQSYCVLMADPKGENGQERMRIMQETEDGFTLSEKDLELRGPGDFFGRKQSGMPDFKIADVVHDYRALETARRDAASLIQSRSFWNDQQYAGLRSILEESGILDGTKLD